MGNLQKYPKKRSQKPHVTDRKNEEEFAASIFTCEICYEPKSSKKKFNNKKGCIHPFCVHCIAKYIQVKVKEGKEAEIKCPGLNCNEILDPISCRRIIARKLFDKWCNNLCKLALIGFDKCYCPFQKCSALILNECGESNVKKTKCPKCKRLFCFQCKIQWHAGYRCEESGQERDRNDLLFGELVERMSWSRCPGCGQCVELRSGCSAVKCRCQTVFCYSCGKKGNWPGWCQCRCNQYRVAYRNGLMERIQVIVYVFLLTVLLVILVTLF